jgi:hypothetical protein
MRKAGGFKGWKESQSDKSKKIQTHRYGPCLQTDSVVGARERHCEEVLQWQRDARWRATAASERRAREGEAMSRGESVGGDDIGGDSEEATSPKKKRHELSIIEMSRTVTTV